MKILIQSSLLEITESIRVYIQKRLGSVSKLVKSFEKEGECSMQVEIARTTRHHRKGSVYYVEITLPLPKKIIRIEQYDEDVRVGIDTAKKRLTHVLEEHKERMKSKDREKIRNVRRGMEA